jgi:pimeloyl-ACP methyl ester carboxylesterase
VPDCNVQILAFVAILPFYGKYFELGPAYFVQLKKATLSYRKQGTGALPLLLFHGFGQAHQAFVPLVKILSEKYTLYTFDLFFHGESQWNHGETPLEKDFWRELMHSFFQQETIRTFSVLGFSMGGKFALATLESYPDRCKEIFLLAPDGIKTSFWYSLATYPLAFREIFKSLIAHPKRFHSIATWAHRFRLIDRGILRFVEYQMNTEEKRTRVYHSWVVFRHLKFSLKKIGSLIDRHQIQLTLLVGKHDKIITAANMGRLLGHVNSCRFEILDAGHNDFIEKSVSTLTSAPSPPGARKV